MSDAATYDNWVDANQRCLMAEFARLNRRLTGEGQAEASEPAIDDGAVARPGPAAIDLLADRFGLSRFERDILLLCAGVEMNSELARACGKALDAGHRSYVTFGLALAALEEPHWSALTPVGPLRRWRLLEVEESGGLANARLRIDERVLHYLAGVNYLDPRLRPLLRLKPPAGALAAAHRRIGETMLTAFEARASSSRLVLLTGDDLQGQGDVAASMASDLGLQLYVLPAALAPNNPAEAEALALLWQREAILLTAALLVECADREVSKQVGGFVDQLGGLVFMTGQELPSVTRSAISAVVDKPEAIEQRALWEQTLGSAGKRVNGSLDGIAWQFRLSARTIARTGEEVRERLALDERPEALLWRACRKASRSKLDELAQRIDPVSGWEQLILPSPQKAILRAIAAQLRHRLTVYHDWGFAGHGTRGLGIMTLFAGESGTGKTMAAEVLANELSLDLYRIDLSAVVSKYIGETEKNLRRLFDAAEESGAILLFDEADALFGRRSEVKDSHDRYANIEVSYLLQRMEAYRGLAILTTNMKAALDQAFQRRLRFVLQFPFPDTAQREAIWRNMFPAAAPIDRLDYAKLSRLHMAGGSIRNIALNAAFLAAEGCEPMRMKHLLQAAQSEAAKRDRPLSDAETKGWV
jgi:hypothetical protein